MHRILIVQWNTDFSNPHFFESTNSSSQKSFLSQSEHCNFTPITWNLRIFVPNFRLLWRLKKNRDFTIFIFHDNYKKERKKKVEENCFPHDIAQYVYLLFCTWGVFLSVLALLYINLSPCNIILSRENQIWAIFGPIEEADDVNTLLNT